jgi:glyoxylase-like metal-dependent hydrolase (beta-lactamase superfamily II)
MLAAMARALALNEHAVWWPSTLYQTTTLDLRGAGTRVLVDPGISPWEIEEVVAGHADPVGDVLVTHADWDHVMALPALPDARVTASAAAAERIDSGEAQRSVEEQTREVGVSYGPLELLRVDDPVEAPAERTIGGWQMIFRPGPGHTPDGLIVSIPEASLLVVGDYLSEMEIPASYHSVEDYRNTVQTLIGVIERERPQFVVVGHGRPLTSERALQIADEDLDYVEAILAYAAAGCDPAHAERIAVPQRGGARYDDESHARNVAIACSGVAAPA